MTQSERIELRQKNDWRPNHYITQYNAVPTYQLLEFEEFAEAKAAEETTHAIFNMIESY